VLGRDHPFLADPMTGLGEVALGEHKPADAQGLLERAWEIRSTHTADGGVREQTAFSLAQAIWDAAPADRKHALELATEARDGYADLPDMAQDLALVQRWLAGRHLSHTPSRPVGSAPPTPTATHPAESDELEPAPM
jgi:eukaryotic-like serine/threonine-protein kinase